MQTSEPNPSAAAGQPASFQHRFPHSQPLTYRDSAGQYVMVYDRSPWCPQRYQVLVGSDPANDTLAIVDDFGGLVVTHRRDPGSPYGMTMLAVR